MNDAKGSFVRWSSKIGSNSRFHVQVDWTPYED
jgi:hypothetical protein